MEMSSNPTLEGGDALYVLDAADGDGNNPPQTPVTEMAPVQGNTTRLWMGNMGCGENMELKLGDSFPMRAGTFDGAGNFSGWVQLRRAVVTDGPAGCPQSPALPWLGMVFLVRPRRRSA